MSRCLLSSHANNRRSQIPMIDSKTDHGRCDHAPSITSARFCSNLWKTTFERSDSFPDFDLILRIETPMISGTQTKSSLLCQSIACSSTISRRDGSPKHEGRTFVLTLA